LKTGLGINGVTFGLPKAALWEKMQDLTYIPHFILQYANSDEIGDVADIRHAVRQQLF